MTVNENPGSHQRELVFSEPEAPATGKKMRWVLGGGVALVVLAVVGLIYSARHTADKKIAREIAQVKQGQYTPEQIQGFLASVAKAGNEFELLKAMDLDPSGDTLAPAVAGGEAKSPQPRDVLSLYKEILAYDPDNTAIKDGLEKMYYLTVQRAEKANREGNYTTAMTYYRNAGKIKPLNPEVRQEMELTKKRVEVAQIQGDIPLRRSYESVYQTVQSKMNFVRYLYDKEKKISPLLQGKITIEFIIQSDGKVSRAGLVESSMRNPRFEEALVMHLKLWDFGVVDPRVGEMKMNYPFIFSGNESSAASTDDAGGRE